MTPILKGTAARLGLRKPLPTLDYVVEVDMTAFPRGLRVPILNGPVLHAAFEEFRRQIATAMGARVAVVAKVDEPRPHRL